MAGVLQDVRLALRQLRSASSKILKIASFCCEWNDGTERLGVLTQPVRSGWLRFATSGLVKSPTKQADED